MINEITTMKNCACAYEQKRQVTRFCYDIYDFNDFIRAIKRYAMSRFI